MGSKGKNMAGMTGKAGKAGTAPPPLSFSNSAAPTKKPSKSSTKLPNTKVTKESLRDCSVCGKKEWPWSLLKECTFCKAVYHIDCRYSDPRLFGVREETCNQCFYYLETMAPKKSQTGRERGKKQPKLSSRQYLLAIQQLRVLVRTGRFPEITQLLGRLDRQEVSRTELEQVYEIAAQVHEVSESVAAELSKSRNESAPQSQQHQEDLDTRGTLLRDVVRQQARAGNQEIPAPTAPQARQEETGQAQGVQPSQPETSSLRPQPQGKGREVAPIESVAGSSQGGRGNSYSASMEDQDSSSARPPQGTKGKAAATLESKTEKRRGDQDSSSSSSYLEPYNGPFRLSTDPIKCLVCGRPTASQDLRPVCKECELVQKNSIADEERRMSEQAFNTNRRMTRRGLSSMKAGTRAVTFDEEDEDLEEDVSKTNTRPMTRGLVTKSARSRDNAGEPEDWDSMLKRRRLNPGRILSPPPGENINTGPSMPSTAGLNAFQRSTRRSAAVDAFKSPATQPSTQPELNLPKKKLALKDAASTARQDIAKAEKELAALKQQRFFLEYASRPTTTTDIEKSISNQQAKLKMLKQKAKMFKDCYGAPEYLLHLPSLDTLNEAIQGCVQWKSISSQARASRAESDFGKLAELFQVEHPKLGSGDFDDNESEGEEKS